MAESKVEPVKRDVIWEAVRRFGDAAWTANAAEKRAGQPRIIPAPDLKIPPLVTWQAYRAQLFAKGVRAQPSPGTAPAYCTAANLVNLANPQ
jgi:hypothetical protein